MAEIGWERAPDVSNAELQQFLNDLLTAVKPLGLIGNGVSILAGSATPEGAITANIGSLYCQTDGSGSLVLWVKSSGTSNTGWRSVDTTAA